MKTYIKVNGYDEMLEVTKIVEGESIRSIAYNSRKEKYTKYFFTDYLDKLSTTQKEVCLIYHTNDDPPILEEREE